MATQLNSADLYDVSFAGANITLNGPGGLNNLRVRDFMDDANPIEFPDVEVSGAGANLNGVMIRYAKPNLITCSITVIPKSEDENRLFRTWQIYRVQNGNNQGNLWETPITMSIRLAAGASSHGGRTSWTFGGGTMISGPGGPASTAEGKMQGRTYTFVFATVAST